MGEWAAAMGKNQLSFSLLSKMTWHEIIIIMCHSCTIVSVIFFKVKQGVGSSGHLPEQHARAQRSQGYRMLLQIKPS